MLGTLLKLPGSDAAGSRSRGIDRRDALQGFGAALLALIVPSTTFAGPFDSQPLHERARILRQNTLTVPGPRPGSPVGVVGADIQSPGRGSFGLDWVISEKRAVTLMLLTERQKLQMSGGRQITGEPLMRFEIQGPETAGHSATVTRGNYFIAFLNREPTDVRLLYRASFVAF